MKRLTMLSRAAALGGLLLAVQGVTQNLTPLPAENPPPTPAPLPQAPQPTGASTNLLEAAEDTARLAPVAAPLLVAPPPVPLTPSRYGGLIGQAIESRQPWQLFNPLAPPAFGDGTQHLSVDPVTGRAEGLILISFQLKPKAETKKTPRRPVRHTE